jgi:hypothetical protein
MRANNKMPFILLSSFITQVLNVAPLAAAPGPGHAWSKDGGPEDILRHAVAMKPADPPVGNSACTPSLPKKAMFQEPCSSYTTPENRNYFHKVRKGQYGNI